MRVLILASQLHMGAAELLAVELATNLNKHGVAAELMSMYSAGVEWAEAARLQILAAGVPCVHFLGLPIRPSVPQVVSAVAKLRRLLLGGKFDVIETSSESLGILASIACAGTHVRHVVGLHQSFLENDKSIRERLFVLCTRARRTTRFYAVSEFVKKTWVEYSGTSASRIKLIYNNIAERVVPSKPAAKMRIRAEFGVSGTTRLVLCVGRLAYYKCPDIALEALAPICRSSDLVLLFVGDIDPKPGTAEMIDRMRSLIARDGLESRVRFIGHRPDIPDLMAAADILVHSTQREAFGLVLAEAMAFGLPIVSTQVEGIAEVLGNSGYLMVPPNDPALLRSAVLETLNFPADRIEASKASARQRARLFTPELRTKRMIELFEDALSGRDGVRQ